jgi:group I intron endonuclease
MTIYSIYRLTNTRNGKVYIGKTATTLSNRLKGHLRDVAEGAQTMLHRAIRKHGFDVFNKEVIFSCFSEADLPEMEKHFIREHDCCILDGQNKGYNMTRGGEGFSSEEARLLSQRMLAEGRHPWQGAGGSKMAKALNARKLAEGRHHLAGEAAFDLHSRIAKKRVANGTHNFQGSEGAARTSEYQKKLVAEGKHVLRGPAARERHARMLADGTHPGKREYHCPHCQRSGKGNRFKGFHFQKCKSLIHHA